MNAQIETLQKKCDKAIEAYRNSLPDNNLYRPVRYILSLGGKRIRPILVLLAGKTFDAEENQLINAALAVEIFHNFSLLHDDIMDNAPLRRGKQTVHCKWNENTGILSGDAMLIEAYKMLAHAGGAHLHKLLNLFNVTSLEVCHGQQLDMDFEVRPHVSTVEYLEMIRLKTAVLLGCSLQMGAIIGDASAQDAKHLYNFGQETGIAFQIQDDLLDVFGDPGKVGKQVGGDIIANKKTFLIIKALEIAEPTIRRELEDIYFRNAIADNAAKVNRVLTLFKNIGVDKMTKKESFRHFQQAEIELDNTSLTAEQKANYREFLKSIRTRRN